MVSIDKKIRDFSLICGLLAAACEGDPGPSPAATGLFVAPQTAEGCATAPAPGLPAEVTAVVVRITGADGAVALDQRFERDALQANDELLLPDVPEGVGHRLALYGCAGDVPRLASRSAQFDVAEHDKHVVPLRLHPVDALSCTGTGRGVSYDQHARLGRPRAFPASALMADGRVLLAGGAASIDGARLVATATEAFEVYDPTDTLFLPSADRGGPPGPRTMLAARVGARAAAYGDGALIVGGAPVVEWGDFVYGPMRAVGGLLSTPVAERFVPELDGFAEVRGVDGGLAPRLLPAVARDPAGDVVVVGGLAFPSGAACSDACPAGRPIDCPELCAGAPSAALEVVTGTSLRRLVLDVARVGATVTPLGERRFLVWGGDVATCGAQPAALIDLGADPPVRVLALETDEPPSSCPPPAERPCRSWWPTAWHAAAALPEREGTKRVLITGGVLFGDGRVLNNPDLRGEDCRPNAFIVEVPPTLDRAAIRPADVPPVVGPLLRRALHDAADARSRGEVAAPQRVLVSGGWAVFQGTPTALNAGQQVVLYRDAAGPGAGTFSTLPGLSLGVPRLGHATQALPDGTVLFAGGLFRDTVNNRAVPVATAEVYRGAPPAAVCAAP